MSEDGDLEDSIILKRNNSLSDFYNGIVGVQELDQCQQRWWEHVNAQRESEIQTSTENTAPDIHMCLNVLTHGTKLGSIEPEERNGQKDRQRTKRKETKERDRGGWQKTSCPPRSCSCNSTRIRERREDRMRDLNKKRRERKQLDRYMGLQIHMVLVFCETKTNQILLLSLYCICLYSKPT